jgi:hypothetical protein
MLASTAPQCSQISSPGWIGVLQAGQIVGKGGAATETLLLGYADADVGFGGGVETKAPQ